MKRIPPKLQPWFEARKRFKLSHAEVQMARELGMNPKKLGSLANTRQEPWKAPLPEFIAHCYYKRFGREAPQIVRSLEQMVDTEAERRANKRLRKLEKAASSNVCHEGVDEAAQQPFPSSDHAIT